VDARADIFSLGIVFYEMLAGAMPFTNESPLGLMLEVVQAEIPDIRQINKQVDRKTSQILQKMIAKSVTDRYQNCAEIIADLGPAKSQLNLKQIEAQRQAAPAAAKSAKSGIPTGDIPTAPALAALTGGHTQLAQKPDQGKKGRGAGWLAAATLFVVVAAAATGYYSGYLPMPFKGQKQPAVMLAGDNLIGDEPQSKVEIASNESPQTNPATPTGASEPASPSPLFTGLMGAMRGDSAGKGENRAEETTQNPSAAANPLASAASLPPGEQALPVAASDTPLAQSEEDEESNGFAIDVAPSTTQVNLLPARKAENSAESGLAETPTAGMTDNLQASLDNARQPVTGQAPTQIMPSRQIQLPPTSTGMPAVASINPASTQAAAGKMISAATQASVKKTAKAAPVPLNKGVVVLVFGDPAVANPIEKTLESELRANQVKVLNEQFIPGFTQLLEKGADLATLRQAILKNGGRALLVANINPTGTQELTYYGRSSTLTTAQLDVDGYDLRSGETIAGYGNTLSYTPLNATEKATEAVMPFVDRLVQKVKQKTRKK
jgi:serine/threonine-protein kinase